MRSFILVGATFQSKMLGRELAVLAEIRTGDTGRSLDLRVPQDYMHDEKAIERFEAR